MEYFFKVANHDFCLILNKEYDLQNYDPFRIDKSTDLIFTASQVDNVSTDNAQLLYAEDHEDDDMTEISIYKQNDDYIFEVSPSNKYPVSARIFMTKDFSSVKFQIMDEKQIRFVINTVLMLAYAFRTVTKDTLLMHSSVIVKDKKGYMFLGKSGTGKSTHSSLWLKYIGDCFLLNDDNPVIRIENDKALVYGSPWSGKTKCYKQDVAEIGALVDLTQHKENKIARESNVEAYASLYTSVSKFNIERSISDALFDTMNSVIMKVPFYHLWCLPDEGAAKLCYDTIH